MSKAFPYLLFALLAAASFTAGTILQPISEAWARQDASGGIIKVLLGDGRRLFANHFFVKADVSFHSGYYPSIFDQAKAPKDSSHLTRKDEHDVDQEEHGDQDHGQSSEDPDHQHDETCGHQDEGSAEAHDNHEDEHEKAMAFLGQPRDWIEQFGRNFMITDHKHLSGGKEREMLPWLRISAELDPHRPETYTVAAYWLRDLKKYKEAEAFLREGIRNNPDSYEIYFEFGRLCYEDYKDVERARNLWELALRKWNLTQAKAEEPDLASLGQVAMHLAHLEEEQGNLQRAIDLIRLSMKASPHPEALQAQITELQQKLSGQAP